MYDTVRYYLNFYQASAIDFWDNLTPMQYGCILIGIAVCGWFLMRNPR